MASIMHRDKAFQIKTYDYKHTCKHWNHRNKTITPSFIARTYLDDISQNREWKLSNFRDTVSEGLKAHVTLDQARKAKKKALVLIDGDVKEQFSILWDYCLEIERSNHGTSMVRYHLLTAVGLVANNNIFPVAYAVVEKETRETWSWLLTYLADDLEINDQAGWTFMSDKQKGLIKTFNEVLPSVSHRFCVRYLHNNFKRAGFSGSLVKHAFWAAASAIIVEFFNARIDDIVKLDVEAAICIILDARHKPIITLLEKLRYLLTARLQANRDKADRWNCDDICRRIKRIPCKHAISAIWHKNAEVINYVDDCYKVEMYKRIYEPTILPINGSQLWLKSKKLPPLPSIFSRQNKSGRKQNLRRKEQDEPEGGVFERACWMPSTSFIAEKLSLIEVKIFCWFRADSWLK
ncbi:uncharacterized protein LOC129875565 [Solanum dulcamara]|uniref:uncharacterized protein LOC129875565 n=1 Tax=Solanum dulcamara TaxID=45834 RepID=UPI0024850A73|nr:uncharacterized protein LOC129875565 [Solanum dulcamara]